MSAPAAPAAESCETVVLLHGLGRTASSLARLASAVERDGFRTVNLSYPSRTLPLETLARDWLPAQLAAHSVALEAAAPRVHFVTHSMGGIVVRFWLRERGAPPNLGRTVMLAPPNQGSEVADKLNAFPPFRWLTGANGRRLGTAPGSLPRMLGPWPAAAGALGVIAGDFSFNPLFSSWMPGPNDGKVSVARTHLAGERDHRVLPFSHTWLASRTATARQVRAFLHNGKFEPGAKNSP